MLNRKVPKVLVVGCANMDIVASGCLAGPKGDLLGVFEKYELSCGGKGANQACALAKMGVDCNFMGRVGKDSFGDTLLNNLKSRGVDISRVIRDGETVTGVSPIFLREDKGYDSYNLLGANGRITCEDVKKALDSDNFDFVMMQLEMPQEAVYFTYEYASSLGIPVILDAGPVREWPLDRLKGIFVVSPNETETFFFTGIQPSDEESAHRAALALYKETEARHIVIKMGDKGSFILSDGKSEMVPAFEPDKAIDTTGCGDAYTSAMAIALYNGEDIWSAARYGSAAGALCSRKPGAADAQPSWDEVEAYISEIMR